MFMYCVTNPVLKWDTYNHIYFGSNTFLFSNVRIRHIVIEYDYVWNEHVTMVNIGGLLGWSPVSFLTLRPTQNDRHLTNYIVKCIFPNENVWFSIKISLKIVPKSPMNNIPALIQIMAWRPSGDKPLSEPMMALFTDTYLRHSAFLEDSVPIDFIYRHLLSNSWRPDEAL